MNQLFFANAYALRMARIRFDSQIADALNMPKELRISKDLWEQLKQDSSIRCVHNEKPWDCPKCKRK